MVLFMQMSLEIIPVKLQQSLPGTNEFNSLRPMMLYDIRHCVQQQFR